MFDVLKALNETAFWCEIAEMPFTDSRFTKQKNDAAIEELIELKDAKIETHKIDAIVDVYFTHLSWSLSYSYEEQIGEFYFLGQRTNEFISQCNSLGYNPTKVWDEVIQTNMNKFKTDNIFNRVLLRDSINHYNKMGLNVELIVNTVNRTPYLFLRTDSSIQTDINGKEYYADKIMKPVDWEEPDWNKCKI